MAFIIRCINISMVASIALFFSIVALDNIIDFRSNWLFVQHVLSMDTTFRAPALMGRAITDPSLQYWAYYLIIFWEILAALICWVGAFILLFKIRRPEIEFNYAKRISFFGLFLGYVLYMVGFIILGGEWFSMWQSPTWNGQMKAGLFITIIMLVMIFLKHGSADHSN